MPAFGSHERPVHTGGTDLHFALCQLQRFAQAQKAAMTRASASYGFDFLNLGLGGRAPANTLGHTSEAHAINATSANPSPPCTPAAPSSQPPLPPAAPPLPSSASQSGSQRSTTASSAPSSARNHSHNSWTIPTPPRPPSPKQVPRKEAIGSSSSSSQKHKSLSRSQSAQPGSLHHSSQHTTGGHTQPQAAPAHSASSSSSSSAKPQPNSASSSSRDRRKEKENLPSWAQPAAVKQSLKRMTRLDPDEIFAPPSSCDLNELFGAANSGSRRKRTSSANWTPDQFTALEEVEYKGVLGLEKGLTSQFIRDNSPTRA